MLFSSVGYRTLQNAQLAHAPCVGTCSPSTYTCSFTPVLGDPVTVCWHLAIGRGVREGFSGSLDSRFWNAKRDWIETCF